MSFGIFFKRVIRNATKLKKSEKDVNCAIQKKKNCFVLACNNSKRTTAVSLSERIGYRKSDRSNKTSARFDSWGVGLQNFLRKIPYSWLLLNYESVDHGSCGTHEIFLHIFFGKEKQWDKCNIFFRVQRIII